MKLWQKILLIVSILVCLAVIILSWGSIICAILLMMLLTAVPMVIVHKIISSRDGDYFDGYDS